MDRFLFLMNHRYILDIKFLNNITFNSLDDTILIYKDEIYYKRHPSKPHYELKKPTNCDIFSYLDSIPANDWEMIESNIIQTREFLILKFS